MNIVVYASYTGECQRIAQYLSKKTGYLLCAIEEIPPASFENLILVFPVHCQNIPEAVKRFFVLGQRQASCRDCRVWEDVIWKRALRDTASLSAYDRRGGIRADEAQLSRRTAI